MIVLSCSPAPALFAVSLLASMALSQALIQNCRNRRLPLSTCLSADSDSHQDFIDFQKSKGSPGLSKPFAGEQEFLENQRRVFDEMSDWFNEDEAIPEEVRSILFHFAQSILESAKEAFIENSDEDSDDETNAKIRVLDVACGTGALFEVLIEAANLLGVQLEVVGVDLSPRMVDFAQARATKLTDIHPQHQITVITSNIVDFADEQKFNTITVNGCFGNFWDQTVVLSHMSELLEVQGSLHVTHPLGSEFVGKLNENDPESVPNTLPASNKSWDMLTLFLPLELIQLREMYDSKATYFATLRRLRRRLLPKIMQLRGRVDTGYGRGGKKLGFPTANLPSSEFDGALSNVTTGVYFGWAQVENERSHGQKPTKAVVNVGYSPTFAGKENPEKIVEAHLITDMPMDDFYGRYMRLQLSGFLRPEIKFPSFPHLIAQIEADVRDAKQALDVSPYDQLAGDDFFHREFDNQSSWNFQDTHDLLEAK